MIGKRHYLTAAELEIEPKLIIFKWLKVSEWAVLFHKFLSWLDIQPEFLANFLTFGCYSIWNLFTRSYIDFFSMEEPGSDDASK